MPPVNERDVEPIETEHGDAKYRRTPLSDAASDDGDPGIGCSRYEVPPERTSMSYHYHAGNAEAMYVLEGSGTLRLDGEEVAVEAGDYVPFPPGPAGAHKVLNDSDAPLRYLMLSTMRRPGVTVYPDSEKIGVYAGSPPDGREGLDVDGCYPLDADVDYWHGEE